MDVTSETWPGFATNNSISGIIINFGTHDSIWNRKNLENGDMLSSSSLTSDRERKKSHLSLTIRLLTSPLSVYTVVSIPFSLFLLISRAHASENYHQYQPTQHQHY